MAYDRKKAGRSGGYYSQSVRVDGRAVKRYVGNGPEAERLAAEVEQRRLQRFARKQLLEYFLEQVRAFLEKIPAGVAYHPPGWGLMCR